MNTWKLVDADSNGSIMSSTAADPFYAFLLNNTNVNHSCDQYIAFPEPTLYRFILVAVFGKQ